MTINSYTTFNNMDDDSGRAPIDPQNSEYFLILSQLLKNSREGRRLLLTPDEYLETLSTIDIDSFLDLIYSLFQENNYLSHDGSKDITDKNKITLSEIAPDYTDSTNTKLHVTYEIVERKPAAFQGSAKGVSSDKYTQYRPRYLCEFKSANTGELVIVYLSAYDNVVKFTAWSEQAEDARLLASFVESFFTRYYRNLRTYVSGLVYIGRERTITSSDSGNKRMFGIPMSFLVRTEEPGYMREAEIADINVFGKSLSSCMQRKLSRVIGN